MHDLDRTQFEFDPEEGLSGEDFEFDAGEFGEQESPFNEVEEMEMAAQLLEITDEAELDQFLGGLMKKAGKFFKSPVGRTLGGMLKGVVKKALPTVGGALGTMIPIPGVGTALGATLGSAAGKMFGLELEGLSDEDAQYEVARRVVRLAGDSAQKAASMPPTMPSQQAAKTALIEAAKRHAPGLITRAGSTGMTPAPSSRRTGRWIRRGSKIILYGVYY
jgi:hypothetical protein